MKRPLKWPAIALVALLLLAGLGRALYGRKEQQLAVTSSGSAAPSALELAAADVVQVQSQSLVQSLPIAGAIKAVQSALVKARVPGELQGLSVREGDAVQAGQVLARIEASEYQARLRQAQQQADAAKAQLDIAQRQWDNNQALVQQGFISKTALDTSANNLAAAQANYKAAIAGVDLAQKALDDSVLRAPIAGLVSQRLAQPGERVSVDARIVEIVDLRRLEMEATLSGADSVAVRLGQTAQLTIEGLSQSVSARVVRINPSAQAGSRSVLVYLALERSEGLLQGLFTQGTLALGQVTALAVPLTAVRTDRPQPYVQLLGGGAVSYRNVTPGVRGEVGQELWVSVAGLSAGDLVLRGHVGSLREGQPVRMASTAPAGPASAAGVSVTPSSAASATTAH